MPQFGVFVPLTPVCNSGLPDDAQSGTKEKVLYRDGCAVGYTVLRLLCVIKVVTFLFFCISPIAKRFPRKLCVWP